MQTLTASPELTASPSTYASNPAIGVSFIVPVYNEEDNVRPLVEELTTVGKKLNRPYELILVDDGSKDATVMRLQALLPEFPELRVVCLKRNFGQTPATAAGFAQARGKYIVTLDGDLQNDPSEVPKLIEMMDTEEVDIIQGWRQARKDNAVMRKLPSAIANWLIAQVTGVHVHDNGCSLKVYRAEIAKDVPLYGEMHRFIPALASIDGAIIKEVPVQHRERNAGTSKYGIGRTFKVLLDLMTVLLMKRFFTRPIHLFGRAGMMLIGLASLIGLYLAYQKFWLGFSIGNRPLFVLDGLLFLTGVQLVSTGLIAEIQVRTYYESQQKPIYKIKAVLSVDNPTGKAS
jgi:glycosyltransferase involved in cell wall biosynthesis